MPDGPEALLASRVGMGRTQSGLSLGALLMAGAAFAWEWCPSLGYAFAALVPLTLLVTFAPRLPLLHAAPRIGAPKLEVTVSPIARWDLPADSRVLQVGVRAATRLADALVNLVLPYDVPFYRSHQDGSENPGGTILTTSERVDGDRMSHYWEGKPDLRRGSNLLYFVFRAPRERITIRLFIDSERLYRPYNQVHEIPWPTEEVNEPPDWRSRGEFVDKQAGHLVNLENERAGVMSDLWGERDLRRREDLRGRLAHIDKQIEVHGDPRKGYRDELALALEQIRARGHDIDPSGAAKSDTTIHDMRGWALEAEKILLRVFPQWADRFDADAPLEKDLAAEWLKARTRELEEILTGLDSEAS